MAYRPVLPTHRVLIVICGMALLALSGCDFAAPQAGRSHTPYPVRDDPERRCEPLGNEPADKTIDISAFVGMPEPYTAAVVEYVEAIFDSIGADSIKRRRYYHNPRASADPDGYPDHANPVADRDIVVPLILLPRPAAVSQWANTQIARKLGWRSEPIEGGKRGTVYGRTLIFEPGTQSINPESLPAAPLGTFIPSWDLYIAEQDRTFFLKLKKLVLTPRFDDPDGLVTDDSRELRLGEVSGARLLSEITTIPVTDANERLFWTAIHHDSEIRRFLAYSLVDGNGVKRTNGFQTTGDGPISPYVRPLSCRLHQPRTKQHDELLLPVPVQWPDPSRENQSSRSLYEAHETWCLDDWFPAQPDACWVIREAEDSQPLKESFQLMPASERSDRPVFTIAVFAESEPKQLTTELAQLYQVPAVEGLNSAATQQRLQRLYERVRNFPLSK